MQWKGVAERSYVGPREAIGAGRAAPEQKVCEKAVLPPASQNAKRSRLHLSVRESHGVDVGHVCGAAVNDAAEGSDQYQRR